MFNRTVTGSVSRWVNEEMILFVHLTKQQVPGPDPLNATLSIHTERHLLQDRPDNEIAAATGPIGTFYLMESIATAENLCVGYQCTANGKYMCNEPIIQKWPLKAPVLSQTRRCQGSGPAPSLRVEAR